MCALQSWPEFTSSLSGNVFMGKCSTTSAIGISCNEQNVFNLTTDCFSAMDVGCKMSSITQCSEVGLGQCA